MLFEDSLITWLRTYVISKIKGLNPAICLRYHVQGNSVVLCFLAKKNSHWQMLIKMIVVIGKHIINGCAKEYCKQHKSVFISDQSSSH